MLPSRGWVGWVDPLCYPRCTVKNRCFLIRGMSQAQLRVSPKSLLPPARRQPVPRRAKVRIFGSVLRERPASCARTQRRPVRMAGSARFRQTERSPRTSGASCASCLPNPANACHERRWPAQCRPTHCQMGDSRIILSPAPGTRCRRLRHTVQPGTTARQSRHGQ